MGWEKELLEKDSLQEQDNDFFFFKAYWYTWKEYLLQTLNYYVMQF